MLKAILDDIKDYFTSLLKKEGRFHLISGILSIIISVLEIFIFNLFMGNTFSLIIFLIYAIAIYYGYKYLSKYLQQFLIKAKVIKYIPEDYTFNGFDGMYDERVINNINYKAAVDHYEVIMAYIVIFTLSFFIYLFIATTYGLIARVIFCLISAVLMYFLTIEPVEYQEGNKKQPSIIDKIKDGLGLGNNKSKEDISSITNVIDTFKQNELNQQPVQQVQQEVEVLDEPVKTDDYYQNKS